MISGSILEMARKIRLAADILVDAKRGRELTVFPDDIFIVSYPKSGNTWVRFLVGNLLFRDKPINFINVRRKIPDIYQNKNRNLLRIPRPRILKSHEYFDPRYKRVIYIVRDPRDIAVSYYYHCLRLKWIAPDVKMNQFLNRFLKGEIDNFGSWKNNVGSWLYSRKGDHDFLLIRYEDIIKATEEELKKIAIHLEMNVTDESIVRAVELSSFDSMKELDLRRFNELKPNQKMNNELMHVRKGQSGGWKKELPKEGAERIERAWRDLMLVLGYLS